MVRNGRGQRRGGPGNARQLVRAAQKQDHGHKIVPALRPPQIVRLPWNSYTYSATFATAQGQNIISVTIGSIRGQINSRMGFIDGSAAVALKVQAAYAWNTAIGPTFAQPSMESLFFELNTDSGGAYSVRSEQYDHGTLNIPARGGYLYPLTDRKEVHTSTNDSHVVARFVTPDASQGNVTIRVMVLWNSSAVPAVVASEEEPAQNPPQVA